MTRRFEWPRISFSSMLRLWGIFVAVGLVQATVLQFSLPVPFPGVHLLFVIGTTAAWLSLPAVLAATVYAPEPAKAPARFLAVHACGHALFALGCALFARPLEEFIYRAAGVAADLPTLGNNLLFQLQNTLPGYVGLAAFATLYLAEQQRTQVLLAIAEHERVFARSRLDAQSARIEEARLLDALSELDRLLIEGRATCADERLQALADDLRSRLDSDDAPTRPRDGAAGPPPQVVAKVPPRAARAATAARVTTNAVDATSWEARPRAAIMTLLAFISVSLLVAAAMRLLVPRGYQAEVVPLVGGGVGPWQVDAFLLVGSLGRAVGAWAALPVPVLAARCLPRASAVGWAPFLAIHGLACGVFSIVWCAVARGFRRLCVAAFGLSLPSASFGYEVSFEFQRLFSVYFATVLFVAALQRLRENFLARRQSAELEARVADSRLAALTARIEPHFLFNALNTLKATMHADVTSARVLLGDLADLLRAAATHSTALWSLKKERALLVRFARFVHVRFGDRVRVEVSDSSSVHDDVVVPRLCAQLLVENAVKHNQRQRDPLAVRLVERRARGSVEITVQDDGRGFSSTEIPVGGALSRLSEILALTYGGRASLTIDSAVPGDTRVTLRVPTTEAP